MKLILIILATAAAFAQSANYPFVIKPLAGTSVLGNGGPAMQALLKTPYALAAEPGGGYAILDADNYQVRRVAADGTITAVVTLGVFCNDMKSGRDGSLYLTSASLVFKVSAAGEVSILAGNGVGGTTPDGGLATAALLDFFVDGIALDSTGNVYFVDGQRVRQITAAGVLRTVAGTGEAGYNGDNRPAASAQLNYPWGIAVDAANNLYIADRFNARIRKVSGGTITTIAGNGSFGMPVTGNALSSPLMFPEGITADSSGNVYVADIGLNGGAVVKIDSSGVLTRLAGGAAFGYADGPGTATYLSSPTGIALDTAGNVLFSEIGSNRVRQIAGGNVRTVAGRIRTGGDGGPATAAVLQSPLDAALDTQGNLYISDGDSYRIRKVAPSGVITTAAGTGLPGLPNEGVAANTAAIPQNYAVAADARGNVYFAAQVLVYRISPAGAINIYAGSGAPGDAGDGGPAVRAGFRFISGLAVDPAGNLYIADHANNRVRVVSASDGIIRPFAGTGVAGSAGDNGPATAAQLRGGIAMPLSIDRRGNTFIGDGGNFKIRMVAPSGVITTVAGNGTQGNPTDGAQARNAPLNYPSGLAADDSGVLYIATRGLAVYRVEGGVIRAIAGVGSAPPANDTPALFARGFEARGMRLDANGDLIVADRGAGLVRKLMLNSPSDLSVADGNNQSGRARSALANPLKVQVNGRAGLGVPNVPVNFAVTAGTATLSAAGVPTDSSGAATVTVTLGAPERVTITATAAGLKAVTFTVTVTAAALTVAPDMLAFSEGAYDPQMLTVTDGLAVTASAAVEADVAWLVAELTDGGVKVSVTNLDMLAAGTYKGTVTISAADAEPASIGVPVVLTLN